MNPMPLLAFSIVGLVGLAVGLFSTRRLWMVADTPTIPAGHAFPGRIEIHGRAELPPGHNLTSPFTGSNCAWWKVEIQREQQSGKSKEWKTKGTVTSEFQVLVRDDSGLVRVDLGDNAPSRCRSETIGQSSLPNVTPTMLKAVAGGALLHTLSVPVVPPRNLLATVIGAITEDSYSPDLNLATASGDWRVVEQRIEVGDELYVLGNARSVDAGPLLMSKKHGSLFAYRGQERTLLRNLKITAYVAIASFVIGAAGAVGYLKGEHTTAQTALDHFSIPFALLAGWLALLLIGVVQAVRIRNRIVAAREQVYSSWGLIDVASAKRAALVPNLVEVVKAAAAHEVSTLEHLALARTQSIAAAGAVPDVSRLQASSKAHSEGLAALEGMRALQEHYPSIHTNPNYMQLFRELTDLENNVAAARSYYIDAQTVLRTRLQTFPDSWLAEFAGKMPPELTNHTKATAASVPAAQTAS